AELRGFLVALALGRLEHLRAQVSRQLVVAALEEQPRVLDGACVFGGATNRLHARGDTALDVVFEARPVPLAGDHLVARPDPEQLMAQRHRLSRGTPTATQR